MVEVVEVLLLLPARDLLHQPPLLPVLPLAAVSLPARTLSLYHPHPYHLLYPHHHLHHYHLLNGQERD